MSKFCKNCGTELKDDDTFCTNCGAPIDGNGNAPQSNIENKVDRTPEIILAIIGGVFGFINGISSIYDAVFISRMGSTFSSLANSVSNGSEFGDISSMLNPIINIGSTGFIISGIISIIGAILAIYAGYKIRKDDSDKYGILLIVATILFIFGFSLHGTPAILLTAIAAILVFVRK